jgi:hypothetical protein
MEEKDHAALTPAAQDLVSDDAERLKNDFLGGVSWFYWIGALSLVNIGFLSLANMKFIVGLGLTEVFYAIAMEAAQGIPWMAAAVLVSALFIGLGYMGRKGKKAFILGGLVFYVLDAGILIMAEDFLSVLFHAYAGFKIFRGYQALGTIVAAARAAATEGVKPQDEAVRIMPEEKQKDAV